MIFCPVCKRKEHIFCVLEGDEYTDFYKCIICNIFFVRLKDSIMWFMRAAKENTEVK